MWGWFLDPHFELTNCKFTQISIRLQNSTVFALTSRLFETKTFFVLFFLSKEILFYTRSEQKKNDMTVNTLTSKRSSLSLGFSAELMFVKNDKMCCEGEVPITLFRLLSIVFFFLS